ncbi:MAG: glycosyltransferase [Cyanobium sp.]
MAPWAFSWPVQLLLALKPSLQQRLQAVPTRKATRLLQRRLQRLQAGDPLLGDLQQRQHPQASAGARGEARLGARVEARAEARPPTRLTTRSEAWAEAEPAGITPALPFLQRPFGVNLIGHAFEVFGVGEDIRMAARALAAVGVPTCVLDHPAANGACRSDHSLEDQLQAGCGGGPYAFNLICMTAPIQARWLLQTGLEPLRERYTIAAWPWETERWPAAWQPLFQVVDELWPASRFTARALQGANRRGLPLQLMPMAAEIPQPQRYSNPGARRRSRAQHGLPQEAVLVLVCFDLNSTAIRKNPAAAIEAFQLAFPPEAVDPLGRAVALVLKTFPTSLQRPEFEALQQRYQADDRLHWISRTLARQELLALYGCCDVYLSLHRSEGYGRGLAEALQLGLELVATDYGGNTDFCNGPRAHPVRWQRVPIPPGAYPRADGQHWAEPDRAHAAQLLRHLVQHRLEAAALPQLLATSSPPLADGLPLLWRRESPLAAGTPRLASHQATGCDQASAGLAPAARSSAARLAAGLSPAGLPPAGLPAWGLPPAELGPAELVPAEQRPAGLLAANQAPPHEREAAAGPFSFAEVGGRYRARLETLWQQRQQLADQLTWRQDRSPLPR